MNVPPGEGTGRSRRGALSRPTTDCLTVLAAEQQRRFDAATPPAERKRRGHFGTAPSVADFMAGMFPDIPPGTVRVLDPGAGVGTLSAALCQRVLCEPSPRHLVFELWENDPSLAPYLRRTMDACQRAIREAGHEMEFTLQAGDFVLDHSEPSLFSTGSPPTFDLVITNPPYFKVRKDEKLARVMEHVVHGQPNIYAFFLAVAAGLLRDGGEMVAITPRSYFNGPYFRRFRKWFFDRMTIRGIHSFESRTDAFQENDVLQENVILLAERGGGPKDVTVTSSPGREFHQVDRHVLPYTRVVEGTSGDHVVRVATGGIGQRIVELVDGLPCRFRDLPFRVSTGRVVTFRSAAFLRGDRSDETAPLLWMHNVRPFVTRFPPRNGKPTHIIVNAESERLLVPAQRYVLLKRFTAKEEKRRLVAGIVGPTDSYSPVLGLENHLNYVYGTAGELSNDEAFGLAALFNSALMDCYFRAVSGSTQVNATEIRAMPVPRIETIREIGRAINRGRDTTPSAVERVVGSALGLPGSLVEQLCEADR